MSAQITSLEAPEILLKGIFPNGVPPHQYLNLLVLLFDIYELQDTIEQIERTERDHTEPVRTSPENKSKNIICTVPHAGGKAVQQDATLRNVTAPCSPAPMNIHEHSSVASPVATKSPFGSYPQNFEEAPVAPTKKSGPRPPTVEISDEQKFEIVRLHDEGMMPGEIAEKLGIVNARQVTGIVIGTNRKDRIKCRFCGQDKVIKYGYSNGKQQYKCTACDKKYSEDSELKEKTRQSAQQLAIELRDKGLSLDDVATKLTEQGYPVDRSTVSRWSSGREDGAAERSSRAENVAEVPYFSEKIDERILELAFDDKTPEEISKELHKDGAIISPEHIKARLEELNRSPDGEDDI